LDGKLYFEIFRYAPFQFDRRIVWNAEDRAFRPLKNPVQAGRLLSPPADVYMELGEIDPALDYEPSPQKLHQLTGVPRDVLEDLASRGYLYQNRSRRIPGDLVRLLAEASKEFRNQWYTSGIFVSALGIHRGPIGHYVKRARFGTREEAGKPQQFSRSSILEIVLTKRLREWIKQEVGGFVRQKDVAADKSFGIRRWDLSNWIAEAEPPFPEGVDVPLWVTLDEHRYLTSKGLAAERQAQDRIPSSHAILSDALDETYAFDSHTYFGQFYIGGAFRATQELGKPWYFLNHPFAPVYALVVVPKKDLPDIYEEAEQPTDWTLGQIREGRQYSTTAVGRVLGLPRNTIDNYINRGKIAADKHLGRQWVSGEEVIRLTRERGLTAGTEELPTEITEALRLKPEAAVVWSNVEPAGLQELPRLVAVQRMSADLDEIPNPSAAPLVITQMKLLPAAILQQMRRGGWVVQSLDDVGEDGFQGAVAVGLEEHEGPVLVIVDTSLQDAVKRLPAYDRVTAVVVDRGMAQLLAPGNLLLFLRHTLTHLPGRFLSLQIFLEVGQEEVFAVADQL